MGHNRELPACTSDEKRNIHADSALVHLGGVSLVGTDHRSGKGCIDSQDLPFVSLRIVYLMNLDTLRSLVWVAGFAVSVAILAKA